MKTVTRSPALPAPDLFAWRRARAGIPDFVRVLLYEVLLLRGERLRLPIELEGLASSIDRERLRNGAELVRVWL